MDRFLYVEILKQTLLPFILTTFPSSHRFMQYNDPKHTSVYASVYASEFMEQEGINWWKTAAESPDLNPIENLWHELKEFIRREVKQKTKEELVQGIERFWSKVYVEKYISHLK